MVPKSKPTTNLWTSPALASFVPVACLVYGGGGRSFCGRRQLILVDEKGDVVSGGILMVFGDGGGSVERQRPEKKLAAFDAKTSRTNDIPFPLRTVATRIF